MTPWETRALFHDREDIKGSAIKVVTLGPLQTAKTHKFPGISNGTLSAVTGERVEEQIEGINSYPLFGSLSQTPQETDSDTEICLQEVYQDLFWASTSVGCEGNSAEKRGVVRL